MDWGHLALINERGAVLILGALTPDLQTECVTTRMLSAVGLLFTIFVRYQPGGPSEKAAVLSFLSNPASPTSLSDAQSALRRWLRLYNRTAELNLHYPDPSLLVKGLDRLSRHISKTSNAGFRLASYRHAQRLDYEPTQHAVLAFAQVLLGEVEQQLLAQDLTQAEKKARLMKTQAHAQDSEAGEPAPKAKASGYISRGGERMRAKAKPKADPNQPQREDVPLAVCRFFESPNGCRYGRTCNQHHPEIRKGAGRCYECGATTHMRPQCPRKDGPEDSPRKSQRMKRLATREQSTSRTEPVAETSLQPPETEGQPSRAVSEVVQAKAAPPTQGPKVSRLSISEPLGLLDGGATHALRPAESRDEYMAASPLKVGLATGETDELRITKGVWRESRCDILHPERGRIKVFLQRGCPEVPRALCVSLIRELEAKLKEKGSEPSRIQALGVQGCQGVQDRLIQVLEAPDPMVALRVWLSEVYPEVPAHLVQRVVPDRIPSSDKAPFNRHVRRKVERGKVLLHLFSGSQSWSHPSYNYTLNVEKERGWDLLDDSTFGYLLGATAQGHIAGILAGPPCRTWSRLRTDTDGGPPPLRARDGPERFGYAGLEKGYQEMVDGDSCLLLRTLLLVEVMQTVRTRQGRHVGFVFLEHPADPASYVECRPCESETSMHGRHQPKPPSMWVWPEVQQWLDRLGMHVARCDQGYFGHDAVKPTQVATNSGELWEAVHGKMIPLSDLWQVARGASVEDRIKASRMHAAWAPQLVHELQRCLKLWVEQGESKEQETLRLVRFEAASRPEATIAKLDKAEAWRQHCRQGHLPWRKDCLACLQSAAYMRPHRRQKHPIFCNMMADLAGPYIPGEDTEVRKGKYVLMVVYPFPLWTKTPAGSDVPIPPPEEYDPDEDLEFPDNMEGLDEPPEDFDPFGVEIPDIASPAPSAVELNALKKEEGTWAGISAALSSPCKVVNVSMVEILPDKLASTVAGGLSRIYAKLRSYGFPVYGLFTDRGGEMVNRTIRLWCEARSLCRRTTAPESPASNGRTERLLGLVRREARALLYGAKLDPKFWPHAVRHASEQRTRSALRMLACETHPMLPFWALVTIRARTWSDEKWSTRALQGRLVAPSPDVDRGWIVRVADHHGVRFYVSTLVYLDAKKPEGPPILTETIYPPPVRRHLHKEPGPMHAFRDATSEPEVALDLDDSHTWPLPTRRHLDKSPAGSVTQGSTPVPGSFLESIRALRFLSDGLLDHGGGPRSRPLPIDKTLILEHDAPSAVRISKVVGPNPELNPPSTPLPGRYEPRGRVRFCRLTPSQWDAIRDVRPGQVPGLGDLWNVLTLEQLRLLIRLSMQSFTQANGFRLQE